MDELLWLRVAASLVVDASLALLCGLALSSFWLAGHIPGDEESELSGAIALRQNVFAAVLFLTLCLQFLLLTVDFCGQASRDALIASMPDVASTHTGKTLLSFCADAAFLCVACRIRSLLIRRDLCALLLVGCLTLHTFLGHAAADGIFTWATFLQLIHLAATAIWSGGVLVSGLLVVSRLGDELTRRTNDPSTIVREYLNKLSAVSTWAVSLVLLSGIVKGYYATEGSLQAVRSSHWGHILMAKSAVVALTILLGTRTRWLLSSWSQWNSSSRRRAIRTLRAESLCMIAVLLLSAWLANSPPPMD